jgi:hypothetical protein
LNIIDDLIDKKLIVDFVIADLIGVGETSP